MKSESISMHTTFHSTPHNTEMPNGLLGIPETTIFKYAFTHSKYTTIYICQYIVDTV